MAAKSPPAELRRLSLPTLGAGAPRLPRAQGGREGTVPPKGGKGLRGHGHDAGPCHGVSGNTPGGLRTVLLPTLCRCFLRGCRNRFGEPPLCCWALPGGSVSAVVSRVSPPFTFFTFTLRRSVFPYFIQGFHVNCKPRFYRGSSI